MKLVLIVLGVIVSIVVLVVAIGWFLPQSHRASRRIALRQPLEAIWALISAPEGYKAWRPDLKEVEILPRVQGRKSWKEVSSNGTIPFVVEEESQPSRFVTRIADDKLPFGGRWRYELTANGAETVITITEEGEVYNPVYRFFSRFVFGHTATIDAYLKALGKQFGQDVTPTGVEA